MDQWLLNNLVCPADGSKLTPRGDHLVSQLGNEYPVIEDVPIMLVENSEQTISLAEASLLSAKKSKGQINGQGQELYLDTLGISDDEKSSLLKLERKGEMDTDSVISYLVGATNGGGYTHLQGKLKSYPIPAIRLPKSKGARLLDVGCSWGRWSIAAARQGYNVVGMDPSLGAILAAKRLTKELNYDVSYIVADARYIPFKTSSFDKVYSYSVFQHFSEKDLRQSLFSIDRVLGTNGSSLVQMANRYAIRSIQHQMKRKFREPRDFEVRYWSRSWLEKTFREIIGPSEISVDCYFGLGLQFCDIEYMSKKVKPLVYASEFLRKASESFSIMTHVADSIFIESRKC